MNHVPKKARNAWAGLLSDVLSNVADNASDVDSWIKLFMLPRCILFNPPRSRGSHSWWGTVRAVKSRIERWKSGELIDLWTEVINSSQSQPGLRRGKKKLLLLLVALLMLIVLFMRLQMVSIRKLFVFLLLRMSLQLMMQSLMRCFRSILKPLHYLPPFSPP